MRVKLRYMESIRLNNSGATANVINHTYLLNSCYDPDFTGTGGQPRGFDQYAALYKRYVVRSARFTVKYPPNNWDYSQSLYVGAYLDGDSGVNTLSETMMEVYPGTFKMVKNNTGGTLSLTYNDMKYWGKKHDPYTTASTSTNASTTANPNAKVYLHVWNGWAYAATTTAFDNYLDVILDLDVVFYDVREVAPS